MPPIDFEPAVENVLGSVISGLQGETPIRRSFTTLDSTAGYDFATHNYMFDPVAGYSRPLSDQGLAFLERELPRLTVSDFRTVAGTAAAVERVIHEFVANASRTGWNVEQVIDDLITDLYEEHPNVRPLWPRASDFIILTTLTNHPPLAAKARWLEIVTEKTLDLYLYLDYPNYDAFWIDAWYQWAFGPTNNPFSSLYDDHRAELEALAAGTKTITAVKLPYDVAPARSVNLGLRLVYRQSWTPLGVQPGEIVRTRALAPGESDRLSIKITRRSKTVRTMATKEEAEAQSESTGTTKDSSELVNEAMNGEKWNLSKEASIDISVPFASASASLSEFDERTSSNSSRSTASRLSEIMEKTSNRVRRETTVTVSSEGESSFEMESAREIRNDNNEIGINLEYMTLQRQYEVFTRLAQVVPVVYVAETLPDPTRIDVDWIRRHDWVLAKTLRDESFRLTLAEILQDPDPLDEQQGEERHGRMYDEAIAKFATFAPNLNQADGGLKLADIYSSPQATYLQHMESLRQRRHEQKRRQLRIHRLIEHIKDNLLVYQQKIWSEEPGEQRMLRYRKENRRVPAAWRAPLAGARVGVRGLVSEFVPTGDEVELVDVIDPSGPLGYVANYAVFALRPTPQLSATDDELTVPDENGHSLFRLNDLMALIREPYLNDKGDLEDPAFTVVKNQLETDPAFDVADLLTLSDREVLEFLSYLPWTDQQLLDDQGNVRRDGTDLAYQIRLDDWAYYLYKKAGTSRFLVDTDNVYLHISPGSGSAMETFKRVHRMVDVVKAVEETNAERHKNERRLAMMNEPRAFDPDIQKVVIAEADVIIAGNDTSDDN